MLGDSSSLEGLFHETLHQLPCHVDYSGSIDKSKLIITGNPSEDDNQSEAFFTSFRGRALYGRKFDLGSTFKGRVFNNERTLEFQSIITWNVDQLSTQDTMQHILYLQNAYSQLL